MPHISYQDIARAAGVSQMTVSLALRNSPRLPVETRERIQQLARKLGYQRDPLLGSLLSYMRQRRRHRSVMVIGYLDAGADSTFRARSRFLVELHAGAAARAEALGYRLETFYLGDPALPHRRLSAVLRARGIRGLILPALPKGAAEPALEWRQFATVGVSFNTSSLGHHLVASNYRQIMELAWRKVHELGYVRAGLVLDADFESRTQGDVTAHFLRLQRESGLPALPSCHLVPELGEAAFLAWLRGERPDVVITMNRILLAWLRAAAVGLPKDLGLVHLATHRDDPDGFSGVDRQPRLLGRLAVDQLALQLQHHDYGIPSDRIVSSVEGRWIKGKTTMRRRTGRSQR